MGKVNVTSVMCAACRGKHEAKKVAGLFLLNTALHFAEVLSRSGLRQAKTLIYQSCFVKNYYTIGLKLRREYLRSHTCIKGCDVKLKKYGRVFQTICLEKNA